MLVGDREVGTLKNLGSFMDRFEESKKRVGSLFVTEQDPMGPS